MNTYDVSHESPSMYMEQNAELKTLGMHTLGNHAIRPCAAYPRALLNEKDR